MMGKIVLVVCAAILVLSGVASALDFSADMVSTSSGRSMSGKMFVTKDKVRMEMAGAITITRMDKTIAWVIMPGQKMYMEQPFDPRNVAGAMDKMPGEIERKFLGMEMVGTRRAKKYHVVYTSIGQKSTVYQWVDPVTGIPLKTMSEDGRWSMEYKNLNVGAQPDSLFEVPEGYNKFAMPKTSR